MGWLDELEASGRIESLGFHDAAIEPTFPELVVPWREAADTADQWMAWPTPVRLLYQQPAFLAVYRDALGPAPLCPVAERQAAIRMCVRKRRGPRSK